MKTCVLFLPFFSFLFFFWGPQGTRGKTWVNWGNKGLCCKGRGGCTGPPTTAAGREAPIHGAREALPKSPLGWKPRETFRPFPGAEGPRTNGPTDQRTNGGFVRRGIPYYGVLSTRETEKTLFLQHSAPPSAHNFPCCIPFPTFLFSKQKTPRYSAVLAFSSALVPSTSF